MTINTINQKVWKINNTLVITIPEMNRTLLKIKEGDIIQAKLTKIANKRTK